MLERPAETANTGAADDRAALRRVVRQVFIAAIAFVLTAGVWELVVGRLHARSAIPEPFKTKIDWCLNTPGVNTVFIGSSRYFHGIDPAVFDADTARQGVVTHSYDLGFDALDFPELRFVFEHVLADPRAKNLKYVMIEPSLRVRLAPGLEHSQRAITLHDTAGTEAITQMILEGNHDWKRKLLWLYEQGSVSALRLTNVGALTNAYIRPQEPTPDPRELGGPAGNGYSGLPPGVMLGRKTTANDLTGLVANQSAAEKAGFARQLNSFEIAQLADLQHLAAMRGVKLILLAPPTATADIYGEFSAVAHAATGVPTLSFADPITYYDLYDPAGFVDPDHISQPVAEKWSLKAADAFVKLVKSLTPVSEVLPSAGSGGSIGQRKPDSPQSFAEIHRERNAEKQQWIFSAFLSLRTSANLCGEDLLFGGDH
jgi:hypothetical protein